MAGRGEVVAKWKELEEGETQMYFFQARPDRKHWRRLWVVLAILVAGSLWILRQPSRLQRLFLGVWGLVLVEAAAELLVLSRFTPRRYSVGPEGVRIHRPLRPLLIPRESIRRARRGEKKLLRGWPVWGFAGLLGAVGHFYSRRLGFYRVYATNNEDVVLLEADRPYVLSPGEPEEFLRQVRSWIPQVEGADEAAAVERGRMPRVALAGFALTGLLLGAPVVADRYFRPEIMRPRTTMPEGLKVARVVLNAGSVEKAVFYEDSDLGPLSDIRYGEMDQQPGRELALVGESGAVFLDGTLQPKRTVRLAREWSSQPALIDLEGDGVPEFLNRNNSWARPVVVFNADGSIRWTYDGPTGVDDAAAGDVDGDGMAEVVVGFNGDGGLHLLDASGKQRWRQPAGNVWHVEIADIDGDGRGEILHSSVEYRGSWVIRDAMGKELHRDDAATHLSDFALVRWRGKEGAVRVVTAADDAVFVMDLKGRKVAKLTAPDCWFLGETHAAAWETGGSSYLVVLVDYSNEKRAALYVWDAEGNLLYFEVLPEACATLGAMPGGEGEVLLVGCQGKVWKYSRKSREAPSGSR